MATWPVPDWLPQYDYHFAPCSFGSRRDGGKRKHAGCDLYAPKGSPVVAIYPGTVIRVYEFYGKADAVEVDHGVFGVIRYGEIIASERVHYEFRRRSDLVNPTGLLDSLCSARQVS